MLTSSLRSRLSRIARGIGTPGVPAPRPAAPEVEPPPVSPALPGAEPFLVAFDLEAAGTERATEFGSAWEVRVPLAGIVADYSTRRERLQAKGAMPCLVVDIETAGLAAAPLFLVGILRIGAGELELLQLLARDYTEEPAVLAAFAGEAAAAGEWITFNGASFDLPYLADRCAYHGVPPAVPTRHLDLLPAARRRWKGSAPDCRLQTLERVVCGRRRLGDVPGEAIPTLYHEYVRTGSTAIIAPVLHHNAMDLLTAAELWAVADGAEGVVA
jgi:RNase_H superfamily